MKKVQPWIGRSWIDICFILLPPFFSLLVILLFPEVFSDDKSMPDYWWVALILLIDVAHVYSTLYRTYFDPQTFAKQKGRLIVIPFLSFVSGVLLYTFSARFFWSILAYLAVYHFIRQQYGFMRIYARNEGYSILSRRIDAITIYTATIYPMLYWHFSGDRKFSWFVEGDFFTYKVPGILLNIMSGIYVLILLLYIIKEVVFAIKHGVFNIPRNAVVAGTVLSWYFGIVYFNGDMAFTLLNVVSHGIPYMALIWIYGSKNSVKTVGAGKFIRAVFSKYGIAIFLGLIFLLAYIEEGLWDITLWREHTSLFPIFHFSEIKINKSILSLIVPLLALPQVTHYIIDGFIWRVRKDDFKWKEKSA
ncbi:MAG: hypothetical protein ABIN67_19235 [Ferruginibacter sp.]